MGGDDDVRLVEGFTGGSLFKQLDENVEYTNDTWRIYFADGPTPIFVEYTREHPLRYHTIERLYEDLKHGDLPLFSWVDPAYFDIDDDNRAADEHPDHDVTKGEATMKRIYEHLRASPVYVFFCDATYPVLFVPPCIYMCVYIILCI